MRTNESHPVSRESQSIGWQLRITPLASTEATVRADKSMKAYQQTVLNEVRPQDRVDFRPQVRRSILGTTGSRRPSARRQ